MEKPLTVVVSDETILPEICGANDINLKTLEELLGVRIFSRGNEILLDSADDSVQRTFRQLLQQLEDHVRLGQLPGPDLIRTLHSSLTSGDDEKVEILKRNLVVIPNGLRKVYPAHVQPGRLPGVDRDATRSSSAWGPPGRERRTWPWRRR